MYLDATHDASSDTYKDSTRYTSQDEANGSAQDESYAAAHDSSYAELVQILRSELEDWKSVVRTRDEELRRKDHIIAALTERIPEIEAPQESPAEPRDNPVAGSEDSGKGDGRVGPEEPISRPWWRRFFGI